MNFFSKDFFSKCDQIWTKEIRNRKPFFCAVKMKHMENLVSQGNIDIKDVNINANKLIFSIFK